MMAHEIADWIVGIMGMDARRTIAFNLDREFADLDLVAAFLANAGLGARIDDKILTVTYEVEP